MHCEATARPGESGAGGPHPTVGDVFRAHGEAYRKSCALSEPQRKAMRAIESCRTPVLGGRMDVCAGCGYERTVFHSCRNRHCPTCQALSQARWLEGRMARLLPVGYFHVVFTVPDDLLAAIALRNRELFFDAMFAAGSQTLLELGRDQRRLGAQLGVTAVLHTWTRDLRFHPHLHCIVTGGGLTAEGRWRASRQDYLFPVRVLSALFRGKLVSALDDAYQKGTLDLDGVAGFKDGAERDIAWRRLRRRLYRTKWVSYAKPPFAGPESVLKYLGRYTHRVGLSNQRLVSVTDDAITFRTRGEDTATLRPQEFIRRFLQHVLPPGFVKLRHSGLLAPGNVNTKLALARRVLEAAPRSSATAGATPAIQAPPTWQELLLQLTGIDVAKCPSCGGTLTSRALPRPTATDTS